MRILIIIFGIFLFTISSAQDNHRIIVAGKVSDGDTLIVISLNEINIMSFHPTEKKRDLRRHNRLVKNVKKAYPYAKLAGILLREYEVTLMEAKNDKERKKIIKQAEKDIHDQFGDELKELTMSQGKILIKLVDRETGNSSYELVKHFRGSFRAFFYQTFARIFGYNLKIKYDPDGKDKQIEYIVRMIETGQI
jgi:hypothetical protein